MDKETQEPKKLKTGCPWCGLTLRVGRDKKQRPFWRCWRCEVRCFGTETTLERFEGDGWIWSKQARRSSGSFTVRDAWLIYRAKIDFLGCWAQQALLLGITSARWFIPPAQPVDRSSDEFLAGYRLSANWHRGVGGSRDRTSFSELPQACA